MVLKFVGTNLDAAYHTTVLSTHNRQPFIPNLLADSSLSLITVVDHMTQSEIVPNEVTELTPAEVKRPPSWTQQATEVFHCRVISGFTQDEIKQNNGSVPVL